MAEQNYIWSDRKRWTFLGLPFTFTVYKATKEKFIVKKGFFNITTDEVRLYRILDLSLKKNLLQRIVGIGTIHVESKDRSLGDFEIVNIKHPDDVFELLSSAIEDERVAKKVSSREFLVDSPDDDDDFQDSNDDDNDDDDN